VLECFSAKKKQFQTTNSDRWTIVPQSFHARQTGHWLWQSTVRTCLTRTNVTLNSKISYRTGASFLIGFSTHLCNQFHRFPWNRQVRSTSPARSSFRLLIKQHHSPSAPLSRHGAHDIERILIMNRLAFGAHRPFW
jgi:hypothetical protein